VTGATVASTISRDARAKLNLTLRITGRRDDGYHLLDSLVAFAEIGDRVTARLAERGSIRVSGPFASALAGESDNLVTRAAAALAAAASVPADLAQRTALDLEKNLPVASGIGGGSADAAAALQALMALWQVDHTGAARERLALSLGADVPVCLAGLPARMSGIGERLAPLPPLPASFLVLVNPLVACPTGPVFKARQGAFSAPLAAFEPPQSAADLAAVVRAGGNDLEAPAIAICPPIGSILSRLRREPGCLAAAMSGSGGTCFGLFARAEEAEASTARIAAEHSRWWVAATRLAD
jgi:4-diphosphocytidyl-2-C-methyl-D-erythritol kinase